LKLNNGLIAGRNQLQWAVLLLAAAVVLPTVALLWFMSRVVANERLAIKEKLASLYQGKLAEASAKTESRFTDETAKLDKIGYTGNPYSICASLNLNNCTGLLLFDSNEVLIYPASDNSSSAEVSLNNSLAEARKLEFAQKQYDEAARLYDGFSTDINPQVAIAAIMGKSRCLARLGRPVEAIEECQKAAFFSVPKNADTALRFNVENARLLLLSLIKQSNQTKQYAPAAKRTVKALIDDLYNPRPERAILQAGHNLFVAKKTLEIIQNDFPPEDPKVKDRLEKLVSAEEFSITQAENASFMRELTSKPPNAVFRVGEDYGWYHKTSSLTFVIFMSRQGAASMFDECKSTFGAESKYRIIDDSGNFIAGMEKPDGRPFSVSPLAACLPGWTVELYFGGSDVFEKAARKQIAIYIWTGALVILLIVVAGGFATQALGRQIRLNKMKNDFIATVSHELKTPLASMRVLVDTLLEGNIKDENQTEEYLRMTSKENQRLSRMIDNFLTFSRMERNKKAFTITDCSPVAIAKDAIEAVKTKYATNNCQFTADIPETIPDIQADHDAIVTVLVNLLDNACKYTSDDKQIAMKVFADSDSVCFAVSDNGIGLARRHIRKIFDSFYQVDNSLARKAEGCGLGLSIVKFILDAHKGTIAVESKLGKGSTFTVRIPLAERKTE
jgi:signal transduction histidine kinase/tetratricopeptide (TPR) repeat protein